MMVCLSELHVSNQVLLRLTVLLVSKGLQVNQAKCDLYTAADADLPMCLDNIPRVMNCDYWSYIGSKLDIGAKFGCA